MLKQAEASLSSFIGTVAYTGNTSVAAAVQHGGSAGVVVEAVEGEPVVSSQMPSQAGRPLFESSGLKTSIEHANEMTCRCGQPLAKGTFRKSSKERPAGKIMSCS